MNAATMSAKKVITGKRLIRTYAIPARRAYFSRDSKIYEVPAVFPAALCDPHGYVLVDNPRLLKQSQELRMGRKIIIQGGLKCLKGYTWFAKPVQI